MCGERNPVPLLGFIEVLIINTGNARAETADMSQHALDDVRRNLERGQAARNAAADVVNAPRLIDPGPGIKLPLAPREAGKALVASAQDTLASVALPSLEDLQCGCG